MQKTTTFNGQYTFTPYHGQTITNGKSSYPADLRVVMNRREAMRLLATLANILDNPSWEDDGSFTNAEFTLSGTLEEEGKA